MYGGQGVSSTVTLLLVRGYRWFGHDAPIELVKLDFSEGTGNQMIPRNCSSQPPRHVHCFCPFFFVLSQEERRKQAEMLLVRADGVTDENSNASARLSNTATATNGKSGGEERSSAVEKEASSPAGRGPAAENGEISGGGARQAQLASLLCKAEQYSMFIRQSQVRLSAAAVTSGGTSTIACCMRT